MNRLRPPDVAPLAPPSTPAEANYGATIDAGIASTVVHGDSPSILFGPIHYEQNYAYPLVVWLHGDGQDEKQLLRLMPQLSMRNYVGVAPRVPTDSTTADTRGRTWGRASADSAAAEQAVFDAVDAARRRYHIASQRIFLAGAGAGGTAALRVALAYPDRFAGVLSFGGIFPLGGAPLARLHEVRRLPLFLAYEEDDDSAEREVAIDAQLRLFYTACMHVMLRQYPRQSQLGRQMLTDADRWMMDIVTGANRIER